MAKRGSGYCTALTSPRTTSAIHSCPDDIRAKKDFRFKKDCTVGEALTRHSLVVVSGKAYSIFSYTLFQ